MAVAVRQVGASDADDVVQETLVRAWRRRSTYSPQRGSERAWLLEILFDQSRRRRIRARPDLLASVTDQFADHDSRLDVERAVAALPPRQREAITLHYLADLSVADVAVVLGISASAVKTHLVAARAALRTVLELK